MRIVKKTNGMGTEVVFDFDSNPYPRGIIVEGFGMLVRRPLIFASAGIWNLKFNVQGHNVCCQFAKVANASGKWFLVVNIHAGHKLEHFEQAVAIRKCMAEYVTEQHDDANYIGSVIGGDFNAHLYRANAGGEAVTVAWEVRGPEGVFDFDLGGERGKGQMRKLRKLLRDESESKRKEWASVRGAEAAARVDAALLEFMLLQCDGACSPLVQVTAAKKGKEWWLNLPEKYEAATARKCSSIDHVLVSHWWDPQGLCVLFGKANWSRTSSVSDHPIFVATVVPKLPPKGK
eukprot:TRINITY_DN1022_c0_g1_i1.p1 TRINITY_DN1022_c0_g1~~TRINITY_DN1022_c0_g1_i1.p1  ORF type:complete len:289 (-),score=71.31 TRINITY_DN1022_c0_g1_i1:25-891(-)